MLLDYEIDNEKLTKSSGFYEISENVKDNVDVYSYCTKMLVDRMALPRSKAAEMTARICLTASEEFNEKIREFFKENSNGNYQKRKTFE